MTTDDNTTTRTGTRASGWHRPFWLTDMPVWLMLLLVAAGLPRTILADLNVVPPESGILYYLIALLPYAAWIVVAIVRETRKPIADFLVLGVLYGLSLVLVHQVLWNAEAGEAHTAGVTRFTSILIAMAIGIGSGIVVALIALVAKLVRSRRPKA